MQLVMGWFQIRISGTSSNPFFPIKGLVVTFLKAPVPRLKAKRITYQCYKNFAENEFVSDVRLANFEIDHLSVYDAYEHITKTLVLISP